MLTLYRLVTNIVYLLCYPVGRAKAGRGSLLWKGRMGLIPSSGPNHVWLHAASVGEVRVIAYLIDYLIRQKPSIKIHVTVMTTSGLTTALKLCPQQNVSLSYFPLDAPAAVRKTLNAIEPQVLVVAETEIWPNLIREASKRSIPVILVNARMSEKAFRRYKLSRRLFGKLLSRYDRFFFKTDEDARRYWYFDISPDRAVTAGDMKFDAPLVRRTDARRKEIRLRAGVDENCFLFVAGSTRRGEEVILADVFKTLRAEHNDFSMIIAPRHVERIDEIESMMRERGVPFNRYGDYHNEASMVLVDRVGILGDLYLAADLAFVGGTLANIGGHNILEPVWAGCPAVFGPSLDNVRDAAEYTIKNNYGCMVNSQQELLLLLRDVCSGDVSYSTKKAADTANSPTVMAGRYILDKISDA